MSIFGSFWKRGKKEKQPTANSKQEPEIPHKKGSFIGQKYEVIRELGHGGFGIVYHVYSHETKEVYALKTFRDEYLVHTETRELFRKEASVWIELERHPYIVQAYFVDEVSGRLYIVMQYIAPDEMGLNSLEGYLERQPPDLAQSLRWAIQFCYGMEHAYSRGVRCHRDVKPANIMISTDKTVKITDFGLASVLGAPSGEKLIGTPEYMSPEQFETMDVDTSSDIYSFGVVIYEMLTGRRPFHIGVEDERWNNCKQCHQEVLPDPPRQVNPTVPIELERIALKCLEKKPEDRYQSFEELRAHLEPLLKRQTGEVMKLPTPDEFKASEWTNKGKSLQHLRRFDDAIKCYDRALEINPQLAEGWNNKGNSLHSLGRHDDAIKCYDRALEINPKQAKIWTNKGSSLDSLRRFAEALRCYDRALEINPKQAEAWTNKGNSLNGLGRFAEAIKCLDKALEINPQNAEAWTNKGLSLNGLGRFAEAIKCHDRALEIDPQYAGAWTNKGLSLNGLGRFAEAIKCLDKALEINPQLAETWNIKGASLNGLGRFAEALTCYDRTLEINPQYAFAWFNKGNSLYSLGCFDEAVKCYDMALEINPQDADVWTNKGLSLNGLGRFAEAIKCFDRALEINPKQADAWFNKGNSLDALRRFAEAVECYDKALEINPQLAEAWFNKGNSLYSLRRFAEARKCNDKVLKINPQYAPAWLNKGICEDQLGLRRDAAISYRRFIELAPAEYAETIGKVHQRLRELEER